MHLLSKKRYEPQELSQRNMLWKPKRAGKIKTQPLQSQFVVRLDSNINVNNKTGYIYEDQDSSHIVLRKFNDKPRHNRFHSELVDPSHNLAQIAHRQSPRQKFLKQLKTRILHSEDTSIKQEQMLVKQQKIKKLLADQGKFISNSKQNRQKSNDSLSASRDKDLLAKKDSCESAIIMRSVQTQYHELQKRGPSKNGAQDNIKKAEQSVNFKKILYNKNFSKTNQVNRTQKGLIFQPLKANLLQKPKDNLQHFTVPNQQLTRSSLICPNVTGTEDIEQKSRLSDSVCNHSQNYEKELQQITHEFIRDWNRMRTTKSQLYKKFRSKLVKQFPSMRQKYKQSQLISLTPHQLSKKQSSSLITPALQSSIKISDANHNVNTLQINDLSVASITGQVQKQQQRQKEQQRRGLEQMFKQAYFYSKTKNRCFSINYQKTEQQLQEQGKVRSIQKHMTFMSYINKRQSKLSVRDNKRVRGDNIIKNRDSILQLEKQGSPQQRFLLKCLDNAIEDCIQAQ